MTAWGSLGLTGDWANKGIALYGRDQLSGTHEYFREHALQNGDFKPSVHEDISGEVVDGVGSDPAGIGYSGIGWKTSAVRTVRLSESPGRYVEPTYENALNRSYPLSRFLYIYVNQSPGQPLDKLTGEFIKYVLSRESQEAVVEAKFFPLPAKMVAETLGGEN